MVPNSRLFRWLLAVWLFAIVAAAPADARKPSAADSPSSESISVVGAWSRSTAGGASVGVAYFEVINAGPADTLLRIESPAAERTEMHATASADGMIKMRPVTSVDIPAGGHLSFQPGGLTLCSFWSLSRKKCSPSVNVTNATGFISWFYYLFWQQMPAI